MSQTVTTDPPRLTPHEEWRLIVRLVASASFRVAALVYLPTEVHWGLRPEDPCEVIEVSLDFFPRDWSASDHVVLNFGWQRVSVSDPELKADSKPHTTLVLPPTASTGQVIPVCEVRRHSIKLAVLAFADNDAQSRRGDRWRIDPQLAEALPPELRELASGRQSGITKRENGLDPGGAGGS